MKQTGTIREAYRLLKAAEVAASNDINMRSKTDRAIISDLLRAVGKAQIELEYAQVRLREIVDG